jgi:hypothetical protein
MAVTRCYSVYLAECTYKRLHELAQCGLRSETGLLVDVAAADFMAYGFACLIGGSDVSATVAEQVI